MNVHCRQVYNIRTYIACNSCGAYPACMFRSIGSDGEQCVFLLHGMLVKRCKVNQIFVISAGRSFFVPDMTYYDEEMHLNGERRENEMQLRITKPISKTYNKTSLLIGTRFINNAKGYSFSALQRIAQLH